MLCWAVGAQGKQKKKNGEGGGGQLQADTALRKIRQNTTHKKGKLGWEENMYTRTPECWEAKTERPSVLNYCQGQHHTTSRETWMVSGPCTGGVGRGCSMRLHFRMDSSGACGHVSP